MPYATQQQMIERFGADEIVQLTDRAIPPTGVIDAAVLDRALVDADDIINGHLGGRYSVPLAQPSVTVMRIASEIARFLLHRESAPETVQKRYDAAIRFLRDAADGRVSLGIDAGGAPAQVSDTAQVVSSAPVFGREASKGFL